MADNQPPLTEPEDECKNLVRESCVMRSVVRNMVVNMESVLSDLQGIMGDIQSLVVQIDSVTDKIDRQCGAQEDAGGSKPSQHCVLKPHCIHGTMPPSGTVHNPLYGRMDSKQSQGETSRPVNESASHNVLQIKPIRRNQMADVSDFTQDEKTQSAEVLMGAGKAIERKISSSSKNFSHFPKDTVAQSGGIAIVYPTIKCTEYVRSEDENLKVPGAQKVDTRIDTVNITKAFDGNVYMQRSSPSKQNVKGMQTHRVLPILSTNLENEWKESKQLAARQKHRITSVYNKFFQPVTPTEQRSPIIQTAHRQSLIQMSANVDSLQSAMARKKTAQEITSSIINHPISEETSLPGSPCHKYSSIGGSFSKNLPVHFEPSGQNQVYIPRSPRLKHSAPKVVYSRVHGSPVSNRSPASVRRPISENYYYSIESDLDSDAVIESLDNRSLTPDIDWSYLNLIGNRSVRCHPKGIFETLGSEHMYEMPVVPARLGHPIPVYHSHADTSSRIPVINIHSPSTKERLFLQEPSFMFQGACMLNTVYSNPVLAHVFCSEVSSFGAVGYCGCYEAALDSVLENIAGFDTFEEACKELENNEAMHETYLSFDDEFEEDDWDMGMKSDDQDEFPAFNMQVLLEHERFFGSLDNLDKNRNMFAAINKDERFTTEAKSNRRALHETAANHSVSECKENSPGRLRLFDDDDDLEHPGAVGNSFTDEDCCAMKPNTTDKHPNFTLWPKPFVPNELQLSSETRKSKYIPDIDAQLSSSDDTSCQATGTGSPMSFSSPEAAFTSPDTDRFVTSSEGDDLFTSQEEAYFQSSETPVNANVSSRKENLLQLRREFFECLYSVCDKKDKERSQANDPKNLVEEDMSCDQSLSRKGSSKDNISESGSYHDDVTTYNKNINTWTAYAIVHIHADDVSDSTSEIFNDNNVSCSMTSSYIDADNIGSAPGNAGFIC